MIAGRSHLKRFASPAILRQNNRHRLKNGGETGTANALGILKMANTFKPPSLAEVTFHYLGLLGQRARQSDYDRAEKQFQQALGRVRQPDEIRAALALDKNRLLPVQLKSPLYERLLTLSGRNQKLLREYAQEMYDFGEDFKDYADGLWNEAKRLDKDE